jgi:hypothetical protein
VIASIAAVGTGGAVVSIAAHEGDDAFLLRQRHPAAITSTGLETLVKKAREPVASGRGAAAVSAHCQAATAASTQGRWRCLVRYASHRSIRYRITVNPRGAFSGVDPTGQYLVRGCCLGDAPIG